MRKKEREITDPAELEEILRTGEICRLALCDGNVPYVVPLNYGYADGHLYFHCAKAGRKIDIIRKNNEACFEIDVETSLKTHDQACHWGMNYRSIIGYGRVQEVHESDAKRVGLSALMKQCSGPEPWDFPEENVAGVMVLRLKIDTMTGKQSR